MEKSIFTKTCSSFSGQQQMNTQSLSQLHPCHAIAKTLTKVANTSFFFVMLLVSSDQATTTYWCIHQRSAHCFSQNRSHRCWPLLHSMRTLTSFVPAMPTLLVSFVVGDNHMLLRHSSFVPNVDTLDTNSAFNLLSLLGLSAPGVLVPFTVCSHPWLRDIETTKTCSTTLTTSLMAMPQPPTNSSPELLGDHGVN